MRLIDADALKQNLDIPEPDDEGNFTEEQTIFMYGIVMFMSEIAMQIDCEETVDAVPVEEFCAWLKGERMQCAGASAQSEYKAI